MSRKLAYIFGSVFVVGVIAAIIKPADPVVPVDRFVQPAAEGIKKTVSIQVSTSHEGKPVLVGGSGVFISKNGHILTCAHLFTHGPIYGVVITRSNGDSQFAEGLAIDEARDLALIKVSGDTAIAVARIADPRKLEVGQEVLAIGSPLGLEFSVTAGIISALNRDFYLRYNVTQSDVAINPGNSGGPLFNLQGEVVGINSFMMGLTPLPIFSGLGFSTSSAQIIEFLTKYREKGDGLPKFDRKYWGN